MLRSTLPPPPEHDSISRRGCRLRRRSRNVIEILNIFNIDPFLLITWRSVPSRFRPVPVVVPFEKGNIILTHKPVQKRKDEVLYVFSHKIEHQLISAFGTLSSWKAHDPVGMLAIEITIGIHHLGFHPGRSPCQGYEPDQLSASGHEETYPGWSANLPVRRDRSFYRRTSHRR